MLIQLPGAVHLHPAADIYIFLSAQHCTFQDICGDTQIIGKDTPLGFSMDRHSATI